MSVKPVFAEQLSMALALWLHHSPDITQAWGVIEVSLTILSIAYSIAEFCWSSHITRIHGPFSSVLSTVFR